MDQDVLYTYVLHYLQAMDCQILSTKPGSIATCLSIKADKEIMGRYFYWSFVERTGTLAETMTITFCFDDQDDRQINPQERIEHITYGCPLLHRIMDSACSNGKLVRLYEHKIAQPNEVHNEGLTPWLGLYYKISYMSDRKKDEFYPLGINLINGEIVSRFEVILEQLPFTPKIPDYTYRLRPIFSPHSAVQRVETHIMQKLNSQSHTWAEAAHDKLDEEVSMAKHFFEDQRSTTQEHIVHKRLQELEKHRPYIHVETVNAALLYLHSHPLSVYQA